VLVSIVLTFDAPDDETMRARNVGRRDGWKPPHNYIDLRGLVEMEKVLTSLPDDRRISSSKGAAG